MRLALDQGRGSVGLLGHSLLGGLLLLLVGLGVGRGLQQFLQINSSQENRNIFLSPKTHLTPNLLP